jgi:hypothetical protein
MSLSHTTTDPLENERTRIELKITCTFQAWTYCSSDSIVIVKKLKRLKNKCRRDYLETENGAQTKMSRAPVRIRPQGCAASQSSSQTLDLAT